MTKRNIESNPSDFSTVYKFMEVINVSNGFEARGGVALAQVGNKLYLFGGVTQELEHFNDLWVMDTESLATMTRGWNRITCTGDLPTPRSGHAMVAYKGHILLFGGMNFVEEEAFNDLYCLNLSDMIWSYVGETGEELPCCNSHSLAIVSDLFCSYLVVYGGANPDMGPLMRTYVALLPNIFQDKIDVIKWEVLPLNVNTPSAREMHATCYENNRVIICGGRSSHGVVLTDLWVLSLKTTSSTQVTTTLSSEPIFEWEYLSQHDQEKICAHTTVIQDSKIYLYGGFNGQAISNMLHTCALFDKESSWIEEDLQGDIDARFGHTSSLILTPDEGAFLVITGGISTLPTKNDTLMINII